MTTKLKPKSKAVLVMYTQSAKQNVIIRDADGASIPEDMHNRDWCDYLAWVALGNTIAPYVAPAPTQDEVRDTTFTNDAERAVLVERLRNATPAQIRTYINANVTDLASARSMLTKFALVLALVVRR